MRAGKGCVCPGHQQGRFAFDVGEFEHQQVTGEPVAPGHAEALVLDLVHHLEAAYRLGAQ
jgi:hypothetical protein